MCMRFVPVATDFAQAILSQRAGFQTTIHWTDNFDPAHDVYPGSTCAVILPEGSPEAQGSALKPLAGLQVAELSWGFDKPATYSNQAPQNYPAAQNAPGSKNVTSKNQAKPELVFNTRLETATTHAHTGRGMWAYAATHGRCLVPVRAFYENHATERVPSLKTGRPIRRAYRFTLQGSPAFLLAAVAQDGKFSIVTTPPNATMAPIHNRMPLVLGSGESQLWLSGKFDALLDRSGIALDAIPER